MCSKQTQLPPKEAFYSKLSEQGITDDGYERPETMLTKAECRNLRDYTELYVRTDLLLLCDSFESLRIISQSIYDLDRPHFMTLPSLSWKACLKTTKVKLQLLTDPDMYLFFETNILGGISINSHRLADANSEYTDVKFHESDDPSYLFNLDANNLYG